MNGLTTEKRVESELTGTPAPQELIEYSRRLFSPDDEEMTRLTAAAAKFGMPVDWAISPDVGRFMQVICRAIGARRVLEFGTLAGHSALWFARALPLDGAVVSIELSPEYAEFAREQLKLAEHGGKVEVRVGGAFESLGALEEEVNQTGARYDAIFLDADKARYPEFLNWAPRVLRNGGALIADNVFRSDSWKGQTLLDSRSDDPRILAIRVFNARLAAHPQFTATIVPVRAGLAVAIYNP